MAQDRDLASVLGFVLQQVVNHPSRRDVVRLEMPDAFELGERHDAKRPNQCVT